MKFDALVLYLRCSGRSERFNDVDANGSQLNARPRLARTPARNVGAQKRTDQTKGAGKSEAAGKAEVTTIGIRSRGRRSRSGSAEARARAIWLLLEAQARGKSDPT